MIDTDAYIENLEQQVRGLERQLKAAIIAGMIADRLSRGRLNAMQRLRAEKKQLQILLAEERAS